MPVEPEYVAELPKPPSWLKDRGLAEWKRMGPKMVELGVVTSADWALFVQYCRAVQLQHEIVEKQDKLTMGTSEWYDMDRSFDRNEKRLTKAIADLGLSPVTRSKVSLKPKKEDPMRKFKKAPLKGIRGGKA